MRDPKASLLKPPPGAPSDWTIAQDWAAYTPADYAAWDALFERQTQLPPGRVSPAFLEGMDVLRMSTPGVPDFDELSERPQKLTGWRVAAVPGLVPDEDFFRHLANRTFAAGRCIHTPEQIDYLQEPDIFHDVFGHVPLLANPAFADYMQVYGEGGLRSLDHRAMHRLARLYWYTVELGLIREDGELRLYGAGIVSSYDESIFAFDDPSPNRIGFDLERIMRTKYKIDDYQQTYFVIDSYEDLLKQTLETDFAALYADLENSQGLAADALMHADVVCRHGTQAYARARTGGAA